MLTTQVSSCPVANAPKQSDLKQSLAPASASWQRELGDSDSIAWGGSREAASWQIPQGG